ncbi:PTS sugar transporter subunit IIB [Thomasclavelia sp.]|uniref:PTS sugar transporter subunit IIB n=1 Tax=Thomasclavelia sp. TaxID=3025757 RepID=UPI0025F2B326|nr:PTS sugar transporter subunit IIB [Thomasclavelia sp.]
MIRIMLACAGGMSTSLLMNKMKDEAKKRGLEISVDAIGEKTIDQHLGEFDVLLLGPQVRYAVAGVKKILDGKVPFDVIDMRDYGLMNGAKVLDVALKMYEDFYNK